MPTAGCTVHIIISVPEFFVCTSLLGGGYLALLTDQKKYRHNNIIKHAIIAKMKKIFNSEKEEDRISFAENK